MERMTRRNPDGTYRIWMDQAGDFQMKTQGGEVYAFGDLVNKLGKYEDQEYGELGGVQGRQ